MPPQKQNQFFSMLFGFTVSIAALWLTFRNTNFAGIWSSLTRVSLVALLLLTVLNLLFFVLRAYRWHWLLRRLAHLPFRDVYHISQIGALANNVLPLRAGEFLRALLIKKRYGLSGAKAFGNIILERMMDLISLALMLALAMSLGRLPRAFDFYAWYAVGFVLAVVVAAGAFIWAQRRLPESQSPGFLRGVLSRLSHGLNGLHQWRTALPSLLVTMTMWLVSAIAFLSFTRFLALPITLLEAITVTILIAIGVSIPAAPGFVGTYHLFCKLGLVAYGVPEEQAIVVAVVTHFMSYFWTNVTGAISMMAFRLHWRDLHVARTDWRVEDADEFRPPASTIE